MKYDYLLLGGGLQNGLLALAIRHHKPSATIAIVERRKSLGGNHTWSFHADDVPARARTWFDPLVQWRWSSYDVAFPRYRRTIRAPYASFTSPQLHAVVHEALSSARGCDLLLGVEVEKAEANGAVLAGGSRLEGRIVVDARGQDKAAPPVDTGYQKFLGLEVQVEPGHEFERPLVMDATVPQVDGYHFMYVLPFAENQLLLEDTYFSDRAVLDTDQLRARIHAWARARGLRLTGTIREESGVLPMPYGMTPTTATLPLRAGLAGGWFNPATGYSLPAAVRFAASVAECAPEKVQKELLELIAEHDRQKSFLLLLNRLLFDATPAASRLHIFERFYQLPEDCIGRHYAMQLRPSDQLRILGGTPPKGVSMVRAFAALRAGLWPVLAPGLAVTKGQSKRGHDAA